MSLNAHQFEGLYRAQAARVLAYFTRRVPAEDAADLLAETFLIAWRRREAVPGGDAAIPWLFAVARNLVLAYRRERAGRPVALESVVIGAAGRPPDRAIWQGDAEPGDLRGPAAQVRAALATLSELDRELVTLTVWDGLTPTQAAAVTGLTAVNARVRLHRSRARLARELRPLLAADPGGAFCGDPGAHAPSRT